MSHDGAFRRSSLKLSKCWHFIVRSGACLPFTAASGGLLPFTVRSGGCYHFTVRSGRQHRAPARQLTAPSTSAQHWYTQRPAPAPGTQHPAPSAWHPVSTTRTASTQHRRPVSTTRTPAHSTSTGTRHPAPATCLHRVHSQLTAPAPAPEPGTQHGEKTVTGAQNTGQPTQKTPVDSLPSQKMPATGWENTNGGNCLEIHRLPSQKRHRRIKIHTTQWFSGSMWISST